MRYWTYAEIKSKVLKDLGLEQEESVRDDELLAYCNEAIDECESEIHTIYEDYFLTSATVDLVSGTSLYAMPSNIYANKIRGVVYRNGNTVYPVTRIKELNRFIDIMMTSTNDTSASYRYFLINNSAATGIQMQLVPASRETLPAAITMWYLRNANRMVALTDICDIPEFTSFVIQWMKMRCYEKEGDGRFQAAATMTDQQRQQMVETLSAMIPDGDTSLEADTSHYRDMMIQGDM